MSFDSINMGMFSRRGLLQFSAGAAAMAGMSGAPALGEIANVDPSIDYMDPRDNLYAFGKMWGTYADKPVYTAWKGILFASIGTKKLTPLFGYTGFGNAQCKITDEGYLRIRGKEGNFFTDLKTGEVLESWYNPYTEENVEVFQFMNDRVRGLLKFTMPIISHGTEEDDKTLTNEATAQDAKEGGGVPFIFPWETHGSKLFMAWDYRHEYTNPVTPEGWPRASTGKKINPSEHFVFYVPKDEMEDRSLPTARFHAGFTRISPFWPWMKMGGTGFEDGKMMGRSFSYKEDTEGMDNIPPKLLAYLEKKYPEYLEPCEDWDEGAPRETWAAYARQVPPETPGYVPKLLDERLE